jgi:hypothetical protein
MPEDKNTQGTLHPTSVLGPGTPAPDGILTALEALPVQQQEVTS